MHPTEHAGVRIVPAHCWFLPLVNRDDPTRFGLVVAVPHYDAERREAFRAAVRLALEASLGEQAARAIRHLELCEVPIDPDAEGYLELTDLAQYLAWRSQSTDTGG
jgi:hypothetical protein